MNNRNGIAPIALIFLVLAGMAVLGGVFYYSYQSALPTAQSPAPTPSPASPSPTSSPTPTPVAPYKAYLTPVSGPAGTVVTIHGSGFAAGDNKVTFNNLVAASMSNLSSADGKTLTFTVPSALAPNCNPNQACPQFMMVPAPGSSYTVAVISGGTTQTIGTFLFTGK